MLVESVGREEGPVADDIDQPGNSLGIAVDRPIGIAGEFQAGLLGGDLDAVPDVIAGFVQVEGPQVAAQGDPLPQLPQFVCIEGIPQLRLADQNDLEELARVRLQVGEKAELFENIFIEILRLVDQQEHLFSLPLSLHEKMIEAVDQVLGAVRSRIDAELLVDGFQELDAVEHGVEDIGGVGLFFEVAQKNAAESRFPRPDLAGDLDEPVALGDGVGEMGQYVFMGVAQIEVCRIGNELKRPFLEPEKFFVHLLSSLLSFPCILFRPSR